MSQRELQRWQLIGLAEVGKIALKEASEKMGVSYKQAKRIRLKVRTKGVKGLIHGNRGRPPANKISEDMRKKVLELSKEVYGDFNDTHFTEKLAEKEGIALSRETVRKFRRENGQSPKRKRKPMKHRRRRQRMAQEGLMMLWDGSPHRWFGPLHPPCSLMVSMDDATGKILAARFFPFEGSCGYLWLLDRVARNHGIPASVYQDRHGSLCRNDDNWSLEEQLAGRREPTQVGLALETLGIKAIFALSPQAKGRVERIFGTLQDRLVAELRFHGITSADKGNDFLDDVFIEKFNGRFAGKTEKAWRKPSKGLDMERAISFRYEATVGNDNAIRLGGLVIDIPPGPKGRSYAKTRAEVRQFLDGSWRVYYKDKLLAKHPGTALNEPIRALGRKPKAKGAKSHSWIYMASAPLAP